MPLIAIIKGRQVFRHHHFGNIDAGFVAADVSGGEISIRARKRPVATSCDGLFL